MTRLEAYDIAGRLVLEPALAADWQPWPFCDRDRQWCVRCRRRQSKCKVDLYAVSDPHTALITLEEAWDEYLGSQP